MFGHILGMSSPHQNKEKKKARTNIRP